MGYKEGRGRNSVLLSLLRKNDAFDVNSYTTWKKSKSKHIKKKKRGMIFTTSKKKKEGDGSATWSIDTGTRKKNGPGVPCPFSIA